MIQFAPDATNAVPLFALTPDDLNRWLDTLEPAAKNYAVVSGFKASAGQYCLLPDKKGEISSVAAGLGDPSKAARRRFILGGVAANLPDGVYSLASTHDPVFLEEAALGWLLSQYRFGKYVKTEGHKARLVCPADIDAARLEAIAGGEALTRDLINTPANDMGPNALEAATRALGETHGAKVTSIVGDALLDANFPMIHAVGRAADQEPRLIELTWGKTGPKLTLVGKGVCFDTGGLNIKPGASMGLMKKDMGGAATVLGLAQMIMAQKLDLQLRVLIPAVENSISATAFRPQDILTSRKGLTVEINNTDAEGRLVLADALALADETPPDLLVCMATLTGAARVAVGPDLAPFYTDDAGLAQAIQTSGKAVRDPVWQLPFYAPYEGMIEPGIADLDNAPKGGFAGSITAALFLRRFVENSPRFVHFDIYGWQPTAAPARPKGGVGMGARAILGALPNVLDI